MKDKSKQEKMDTFRLLMWRRRIVYLLTIQEQKREIIDQQERIMNLNNILKQEVPSKTTEFW